MQWYLDSMKSKKMENWKKDVRYRYFESEKFKNTDREVEGAHCQSFWQTS